MRGEVSPGVEGFLGGDVPISVGVILFTCFEDEPEAAVLTGAAVDAGAAGKDDSSDGEAEWSEGMEGMEGIEEGNKP